MMTLRLNLVKKFLTDPNLTNLKSSLSTCSVLKSDVDEIVKKKAEIIDIDPVDHKPKLPYTEQRKLDESLVHEEDFFISQVNGVPEEHVSGRLVRIAKAPKNAMQSGTANTHAWILQFDNRQRWENNLMGWISSGDPLSNMQLRFNNVEEATDYCEKNKYPYYVVKENSVELKKKSYANNFSWNKRTRASTK